jgi:hypothetical protein
LANKILADKILKKVRQYFSVNKNSAYNIFCKLTVCPKKCIHIFPSPDGPFKTQCISMLDFDDGQEGADDLLERLGVVLHTNSKKLAYRHIGALVNEKRERGVLELILLNYLDET